MNVFNFFNRFCFAKKIVAKIIEEISSFFLSISDFEFLYFLNLDLFIFKFFEVFSTLTLLCISQILAILNNKKFKN